MNNEEASLERGCGSRAEDGLYLTVESSPLGQSITFFLVDPAIEWKGAKTLRSPMFIDDRLGVTHLVLGVGATFYPFVSDFVEEVRLHGVSKRVPRNLEVERLSQDSKFLLMHPRAIPRFNYKASCTCPKDNRGPHECIGFLWSLSALKSFDKVHELGENSESFEEYPTCLVKTPSCSYEVVKPLEPKAFVDDYSAGIFLAFPLSICGFEYVNKKGQCPPQVTERLSKAGFKLDVVPK